MFSAFRVFLSALFAFTLTACGGGGSSQQSAAVDFPPGQYADQNSGPLPTMHEAVLTGMRSIVFEGDSLTMLWDYTTWPTQVKNSSVLTNTAWNDTGIGGTTTVDMVARYDANDHPLRPSIAGNGIFIFNGGTGDLCLKVSDPATIYARLVSLWAKARADGFKVVAFTIYASCDVPGGVWENYRLTLNQLILSDPTLYDGIVRNDLLFPNVNDKTKFVDKLHYAPSANDDEYLAVNAVIAGM